MDKLIKLITVIIFMFLHACVENEQQENNSLSGVEIKKDSAKITEVVESKEYIPNDTTAKMSSYEKNKTHIKQLQNSEKSLVINYKHVFESVKENSPLSDSLIESLKIKEKAKPWHDDFEYYILDTLELRPGITTLLVIQYYDSESMGFLFNYTDKTYIDKLEIFYDNAEGCLSDNSTVFESNLIYIENYDCFKEDQKQEQENFLYIISDDGKFEEVFIDRT